MDEATASSMYASIVESMVRDSPGYTNATRLVMDWCHIGTNSDKLEMLRKTVKILGLTSKKFTQICVDTTLDQAEHQALAVLIGDDVARAMREFAGSN